MSGFLGGRSTAAGEGYTDVAGNSNNAVLEALLARVSRLESELVVARSAVPVTQPKSLTAAPQQQPTPPSPPPPPPPPAPISHVADYPIDGGDEEDNDVSIYRLSSENQTLRQQNEFIQSEIDSARQVIDLLNKILQNCPTTSDQEQQQGGGNVQLHQEGYQQQALSQQVGFSMQQLQQLQQPVVGNSTELQLLQQQLPLTGGVAGGGFFSHQHPADHPAALQFQHQHQLQQYQYQDQQYQQLPQQFQPPQQFPDQFQQPRQQQQQQFSLPPGVPHLLSPLPFLPQQQYSSSAATATAPAPFYHHSSSSSSSFSTGTGMPIQSQQLEQAAVGGAVHHDDYQYNGYLSSRKRTADEMDDVGDDDQEYDEDDDDEEVWEDDDEWEGEEEGGDGHDGYNNHGVNTTGGYGNSNSNHPQHQQQQHYGNSQSSSGMMME